MQSLAAPIEGSIEISWQLAPRNRISQHPDDLKRPRIKWRERRCHSIETRTSTRSASRRNRWPHVGELISRPRKGCEKCAKGISGSVRSISMETSAAPLRAISFSTSASIRASAGRLAAFTPPPLHSQRKGDSRSWSISSFSCGRLRHSSFPIWRRSRENNRALRVPLQPPAPAVCLGRENTVQRSQTVVRDEA
jgi:hypothetical protein